MARDDIRSQAIAAAAATLSDSAPPGRSGIVTSTSHCSSTSAGRPSRSAPRQRVATAAERLEALAAVGDERRPRLRRLLDRGPQPAAAAKIEPMLARTAFGEKGSAQSGPSTTEPPSSAWAVRTIAPTLPGSPTPCR